MLSLGSIVYGQVTDYYKYFRTDSAYVYSWDNLTSDWKAVAVQEYSYENGVLLSILTSEFISRTVQSRTNYSYNSEGLVNEVVSYVYNNGWVAVARNLYFYDLQNRYSEIQVQRWINSVWVDDRIQMNYVYDENNRQTEYQSIYWRNNAWTTPTTEYSYYNAEELLIRREAVYANGTIDYQVLYEYDQFDVLSEVYAQYPSSTGWLNWWLASYGYNPCGLKLSQTQYSGSGTSWLPNNRVVSYTYFKADLCPDRKVPVCQNGTTIYVKKTVVPTRLANGDCIGVCPDSKGEKKNHKESINDQLKSIPFVVYPNPATDKITVQTNDTEVSINRIELADLNGTILRVISNPDNTNNIIYRRGLLSGQYILRIYLDGEAYNMNVIFN